jgi:hypothetical protein
MDFPLRNLLIAGILPILQVQMSHEYGEALMEIAPITGIRAVSRLQSSRASTSQPAFVIDPATGTANESSTSNEETPGSGLEDEDNDNDTSQDEEADAGVSVSSKPSGRSVDVIA